MSQVAQLAVALAADEKKRKGCLIVFAVLFALLASLVILFFFVVVLAVATMFGGEYYYPLPDHTYISSGYGVRIDPVTGEQGNNHTALDFPAPEGTPILASAGGTVLYAGENRTAGLYVVIQHEEDRTTHYFHCSETLVIPGEPVMAGQVIALVGSTGKSTGNHLHFEIRVNGESVDPTDILQPMPEDMRGDRAA